MSVNAYWSDTRLNGQPLVPGTFCVKYDVEGQNTQAVYGKSMEEVTLKLATTLGHAQNVIARRQSVNPPPPPVPVKRMTPDDFVRATGDLTDPARAGEAIISLAREVTGVDLAQLGQEQFRTMAGQWENHTPEFYPHPGNKSILMGEVYRQNNLTPAETAKITPSMMTAAYSTVRERGMLFDRPDQPAAPVIPISDPPPNPSTTRSFPDESQVRRTESRRGEGLFATSVPSARLRGSQTVLPKTLKYTEQQIRMMSPTKQRELIESNDPDYAAACNEYFGQTASA